jgi:hypothetical protein
VLLSIAGFSLEFLNKIHSAVDESIFPILEIQNNHLDSVVCLHIPF